MKICSRCGKQLEDDELFCTVCGTSAEATRETLAEEEERKEREFVASYKRLLRFESRAFKIMGFVALGLTLLFAVIAVVLTKSENIVIPKEIEEIITGGATELNVFMFSYVISYFATSAVNMVMARKTEIYYDAVDTDIRRSVLHYTSIGGLFVCIMVNTIAMIFFIINLAKIRTNAALLARIVAKQRGIRNDQEGDFS